MMLKPLRLFLISLLASGLSGCFGFFGEPVRAPVFEGDQMVARSGPAPASGHYVVKPGDTLYSIAWKGNMDYRALALWNNLPSSYTIRPGQRLRMEPPSREGRFVDAAAQPPDTGSLAELQSHRSDSSSRERDRRLAATRDNNKQDLMRKARQLRANNAQGVRSKGSLRWRKPTPGRVLKGYVPGDLTRKGVQIGGRAGQSIRATERGKVVYSGSGLVGYGRLIIVKHDKNYLSAYGYNRKILVKEGQIVKAGQKIAEMGRSDRGKPLLHFEIRYKGKPINPASVVAL